MGKRNLGKAVRLGVLGGAVAIGGCLVGCAGNQDGWDRLANATKAVNRITGKKPAVRDVHLGYDKTRDTYAIVLNMAGQEGYYDVHACVVRNDEEIKVPWYGDGLGELGEEGELRIYANGKPVFRRGYSFTDGEFEWVGDEGEE